MCVSWSETKPPIYKDLATLQYEQVNTMCTGYNKEYTAPSTLHSYSQKAKPKRQMRVKVRIHRLKRVNDIIKEQTKRDMEIRNLKLYMENMRILKENERLKNTAKMLHQENLDLLLQLEKKKVKL